MKVASMLLLVALLLPMVFATQVMISNLMPRMDNNGHILDIHDGNMLFVDGIYYWYGADYGNCEEPEGGSGCTNFTFGACGFRHDHNVTLYTSPDLVNWHYEGHVFGAKNGYSQPAIMFCPKVIYNPTYKHYVMWTNWIGASFSQSYYASAISVSPFGPFKVVNENIMMGYPDDGDFNLFVDDDGQAYVIYTGLISGPGFSHRMSVERLSADYTQSQGLSANSGFIGIDGVEAPALFKANGKYYAVFGACCCYCAWGAPVYNHVADNILGPYTNSSSLGEQIHAQQTDIFGYQIAPGKYQYMWIGDRWQSAPDRIKGHDFTYWGPLTIEGDKIHQMEFQENFLIDVHIQ